MKVLIPEFNISILTDTLKKNLRIRFYGGLLIFIAPAIISFIISIIKMKQKL